MEAEKFCAVPMCFNNNTIKRSRTYRKVWFSVPNNEKHRLDWMLAMGRTSFCQKDVYVCGDHFDLDNDMYGYEVYQQCGGQLTLKEEVVPHIFKCQKTAANNRTVLELDKFKRRMIRAVARLLLHEKKTDTEVWTELRKETGCDCQLLWSRMRALTLKKMNRLFIANDHVELIPKAARMSLTDWLMFDLVLVHQKIDVIGQENTPKEVTDDPKPLKDLFELVTMFDIEGKMGDSLAEAWSSATLYYNNKGHQCSPMLLQRRWFQLKEATRNQFYDFWYTYRGAAKRLPLAEPHMPSQLQAAIAKRYKHLVTSPFHDWETSIEMRLVTLPEEFDKKMMERVAHALPQVKKPDDNAPDLVVIEPVIETIDLGLDSDNDNENEGDKEEESPPATEVKIKEEPIDIDTDEYEPEPQKKSKYDEVLESTLMEHDRIDNVDEEDDLATEENEITQAIQSTLRTQQVTEFPQITSVSGNIDDTCAISNIDEIAFDNDDQNIALSIDDNSVHGNVDDISVLGKVDETSVIGNVDDTIVHGNAEEVSVFGKVDDTSVCGNVDDTTVHGNDEEASVFGNVHNTSVFGNVDDTNVHDNAKNTNVYGKDNKPNENLANIDSLNAEITKDIVNNKVTMVNDVEINEDISTPATSIDSSERRIVFEDDSPDGDGLDEDAEPDNDDLDTDDIPNNDDLDANCIPVNDTSASENRLDKAVEVDIKPNIVEYSLTKTSKVYEKEEETVLSVDSINKTPEKDKNPEPSSFSYGDLSVDFRFVDDGIEFVDDGIAYVDEDNPVGVKTEKVDDQEENEDSPKIDAKLLMCPIIYTTRIDDMDLFHTQPFDHVNNKKIIDIITSKSKPRKEVPVDMQSSSEDDDESEENTITDTQKVKPSSYMLQKPRSRSYNPIQLCKNPDFNTRLKRLTAGFFSSRRNLMLFKSCKPLTIDLSKTFESKLVAGTLYLKPSDHNVTPKNIDDSKSCQSVSVVPSAMPVQSLIDNSKISEILPVSNNLTFPKLPDELSSINERSKVINLQDISEIRRINQKLLTAEVTPIQIQNNTPQVPVSIVASSNTVAIPNQKPISFITRDLQLCPSKIVDITERDSHRTVFTNIPPSHSSTSKNLQDSPRYLNPGRPCKMVNGKRLWPKTAGMPWKPRQIRPEIPWLSRNQDASNSNKKVDETLLTLDTLNKMLYILSCDKEDSVDLQKSKPKTFKKRKKYAPRQKGVKEQSAQAPVEGSSNVEVVSETVTNPTEQNVKCCKPKINIKPARNYPPKEIQSNTTDADTPERSTSCEDSIQNDDNPSISKNNDPYKKDIKYCCWARQRMLQMLFSKTRGRVHKYKYNIREHNCPYPVCTCCCRILLQEYTDNECKLRNAEEKGDSVDPSKQGVELQDVAKDGSENIETPVEDVETPVVQTPVISVEPPVIDAKTSNNESATNINEPINIDDLNSEDGNIPALGSEVSVTTSTNSSNVAVTLKVNARNKPVRKIIDPFKRRQRSNNNPCVGTLRTRIGPHQMIMEVPSVATGSTATITKPKIHQFTPPSSLSQALAAKRSNMVKTFKTAMPLVKPFSPPKNFKEKMIFLNSQQISEKPSENPIFLGKNKILLTTVKFPHNLKRFEEVKQSLKPSLCLPNGVQLICLPNGTVTYTVDPNFEVNASQLANLPAIVAAVQQKINLNVTASQQNTLPKDTVMDNEVVNLSDDDDTSEIIENTSENSKNPSEIQVQTTDVDTTKNRDTSPNESFHIETEENMTKNSTDTLTENNQNISQYNTPKDIQETVQELSTKEIPSTSAEDQPETLIQSTNIDINEKSANEPSSGNKSKNILSDLMEMSGIFDEDITMPEETLPQEPVKQIPIPLQPILEQVQEPAVGQSQELVVKRASLVPPPLQKIDSTKPADDKPISINSIPQIVKSPIGELSPITSLYELKYACLNNGIFFKLDFDTGYLVPINVCMKPHPKPNTNPNPVNMEPKAVIDLTDDDDSVMTPNTSKTKSLLIASQVPIGSVSGSLTDRGKVKPLKLFKSVHPGILRRISQNQPNNPENQDEHNDATKNTDGNRHKHQRKQFLKKNVKRLHFEKGDKPATDTNLIKNTPTTDPTLNNLLASDANTVKNDGTIINKYFRKIRPKTDLFTADDKTNQQTPITLPVEEQKIATDIMSDDSSDDEPLAKKAKRKRESEVPLAVNDEEVKMTEENVVNPVDVGPVDDAGPADIAVGDVESSELGTEFELFMDQSDNEDREEEHCILGV